MPSKISSPPLDAGSRFAGMLADCFTGSKVDRTLDDCQVNIDGDALLLDRFLEAGHKDPLVRIWQNGDCLVVPRTMKREPNFSRATRNCTLPVVSRVSGGTAVIHGPHVVNISIAAWVGNHSLSGYYAPIIGMVVPALRTMGLPATVGSVPGSHCDGRFNICLPRCKVGGTAAFVRSRGKNIATLAHASISVEQQNRDLDIIEQFERDLGRPSAYSRAAHISIHECLASNVRSQTSGLMN
jgi:octanoyl-[GcvH]:protein N-octanoyltransferase